MTASLRAPRAAAGLAAVRRAIVYGAPIGVFLSVAGAFGSQQMPFATRTVFMVGIAVFDTALGWTASALVRRNRRLAAWWWLQGTAAALLMTAPAGLAVWTALQLVGQRGPPLRTLPGFMPTAFAASWFFCLWAAYASGRRRAGTPLPTPAAAPRFLERLPPKLRGAELWAVEAEDHYLRLHTSKGQDLVLMRLSDAIIELAGVEGARTHRSWWVARDAVTEVERADGRATLTLKNGARAPVSRTYARALRALGWL